MITIQNKNELRKYAMQKRNSFADSGVLENKSSIIIQKILNSSEFNDSNHIALYFPIKNEIDLTSLLNLKDKNFYLPRCNNNELEFVKFEGFNLLKSGTYGILEPTGEKINPEILDIIYIPALMANKMNYRLGYGKGYYDRFFAKYNLKAKKIIIVPFELHNDAFIQDEFDFQCDNTISA